MGSNTQVEFMIGSLPLAVLTQRCAITIELRWSRDSRQPERIKNLMKDTQSPLTCNDLLGQARSFTSRYSRFHVVDRHHMGC
jgi:hypothetical protein